MLQISHQYNQAYPHDAIESLQSTASYELLIQTLNEGIDMIAVYLRGEAYLAAHQGSQAAAEFQKVLDHPSALDIQSNILPHLDLARAYSLQGDIAKARAEYQDFPTLWKDADPDIPLLKQAKDEYNRLLK